MDHWHDTRGGLSLAGDGPLQDRHREGVRKRNAYLLRSDDVFFLTGGGMAPGGPYYLPGLEEDYELIGEEEQLPPNAPHPARLDVAQPGEESSSRSARTASRRAASIASTRSKGRRSGPSSTRSARGRSASGGASIRTRRSRTARRAATSTRRSRSRATPATSTGRATRQPAAARRRRPGPRRGGRGGGVASGGSRRRPRCASCRATCSRTRPAMRRPSRSATDGSDCDLSSRIGSNR